MECGEYQAQAPRQSLRFASASLILVPSESPSIKIKIPGHIPTTVIFPISGFGSSDASTGGWVRGSWGTWEGGSGQRTRTG